MDARDRVQRESPEPTVYKIFRNRMSKEKYVLIESRYVFTSWKSKRQVMLTVLNLEKSLDIVLGLINYAIETETENLKSMLEFWFIQRELVQLLFASVSKWG